MWVDVISLPVWPIKLVRVGFYRATYISLTILKVVPLNDALESSKTYDLLKLSWTPPSIMCERKHNIIYHV